jgi:hypothetical protein
MAQSLCLSEQTERCRRLAGDSVDTDLRDGVLKLADAFAARAVAPQGTELAMAGAGPDHRGAA